MSGVFISYRRDDSRGTAGRLYDALSDRFGHDVVFRDLDAIQPGAVYGTIIDEAISRCDAVLVVMGDQWINAGAASGTRRLDQPDDLVRTEIASAFAQDKIVIPVLVEDARMPTGAELPPELGQLAMRNALPISDLRWDYDVSRLVTQLDRILGPPAAEPEVPPPGPPAPALPTPVEGTPPPPPPPASGDASRRLVPILAAAVLVAVALGSFLIGRSSEKSSVATKPVDTTRFRPTEVTEPGSPPSTEATTGTAPTVTTAAPASTGGTGGVGPKGEMLIAVGATVGKGTPAGSGNISTPGMKHLYSFQGVAGQILFLKALPDSSPELYWSLNAPSGTNITYARTKEHIGRVKLSADGAYTIEVKGDGNATGTYAFTILPVPPDASFAISIGDSVQKGKPAGAGNITVLGARQIFTFTGAAGQALYLKALPDSSPELYWSLKAPSGTDITYARTKDDIGRVKLSADGPHTIEVKGDGPATGAYGFSITAVP